MILSYLHQLRKNQTASTFTPISFVAGFGFEQTDTTNGILIQSSLGVQSGDLIVCAGAGDTDDTAPPNISGTTFTTIRDITDLNADAGAGWFYGYAPSSAFTLSFDDDNGDGLALGWAIGIFRNTHATNPIHADSFANAFSNNNLPNPPSLTPTIDNCMIIAVGALDDDEPTQVSPPTGFTMVGFENAGNGGCGMMAYQLQTTATTVDPSPFTSSTARENSDEWSAGTIAIAPAS